MGDDKEPTQGQEMARIEAIENKLTKAKDNKEQHYVSHEDMLWLIDKAYDGIIENHFDPNIKFDFTPEVTIEFEAVEEELEGFPKTFNVSSMKGKESYDKNSYEIEAVMDCEDGMVFGDITTFKKEGWLKFLGVDNADGIVGSILDKTYVENNKLYLFASIFTESPTGKFLVHDLLLLQKYPRVSIEGTINRLTKPITLTPTNITIERGITSGK